MDRFAQFAPVYRSFPVDVCHRLVERKSVCIVGAAAGALASRLRSATNDISVFRVLAPSEQTLSELATRFAALTGPVEATIVTDPDWAGAILADDTLLAEIRRRTKSIFMFPQAAAGSDIGVHWGPGVSGHETSGGQNFRWIASENSAAVLYISTPPGSDHLQLSLKVRIIPNATKAARLWVDGALAPISLPIISGTPIAFPVAAGLVRLDIRTDVTPVSLRSDSRPLSIAIVDPVLQASHGAILVDSDAFCRGSSPWVLKLRNRLHSAGFYCVSGTVAGTSGLDVPRPIQASFGSPEHQAHCNDARELFALAADEGDWCWFAGANSRLDELVQ